MKQESYVPLKVIESPADGSITEAEHYAGLPNLNQRKTAIVLAARYPG